MQMHDQRDMTSRKYPVPGYFPRGGDLRTGFPWILLREQLVVLIINQVLSCRRFAHPMVRPRSNENVLRLVVQVTQDTSVPGHWAAIPVPSCGTLRFPKLSSEVKFLFVRTLHPTLGEYLQAVLTGSYWELQRAS
jgi:hypothetical protein